MVRPALIDDPAQAADLWDRWDALAVASGLPYAAPAWQLGWWRAAAPERAQLRVLAALDGDRLVGVLGLYGARTASGLERLRLLGAAAAQGPAPLAEPGRRAEAARAFAATLSELRPRPATIELEGVPDGADWSRALVDGWPGRARPVILDAPAVAAPYGTLDPAAGPDGWLAGRSANLRGQLRRSRRALEAAGVVLRRVTSASDAETVIPELLRLHEARWAGRGGSAAVDEHTAAVLVEAARGLDGTGRLHIELAELDGATVAAHLFLTAGEEMTYWLGGFDQRLASERPGLVALWLAIEHGLGEGITRFDLGPGAQPYKRRFADGERTLDWQTLVLPGPRRAVTRLQLAPRRAARRVRGRVRTEEP